MTERETIRVEGAPRQPSFLSHAVRFGDLVYTSGAAPRVPETHEIPEGFEAQARQTFANLETVLAGSGSSLRLALKVTVYLANIADWPVMNAIYEEYIDQSAAPARTTVEVSAMNNGYLIEVEAIAAVR
ncbi:MAG: RidA family protein [Actinomycetota bacterium]|nr:RidA family protein [Actinomycetota bacterium]